MTLNAASQSRNGMAAMVPVQGLQITAAWFGRQSVRFLRFLAIDIQADFFVSVRYRNVAFG